MIDQNSFVLPVQEKLEDYVPEVRMVEGNPTVKDRLDRYKLYDDLDCSVEYSEALDRLAGQKAIQMSSTFDSWGVDAGRRMPAVRTALKYGDAFLFRLDQGSFGLITPRAVMGALVLDGSDPDRRKIEAWVVSKFPYPVTNFHASPTKFELPSSTTSKLIDHEYMKHISLNNEDSKMWPFGTSWLDSLVVTKAA